jgi:membrane-associated protein
MRFRLQIKQFLFLTIGWNFKKTLAFIKTAKFCFWLFSLLIQTVMELIDFILHIDRHLSEFIVQYHNWVYLILFLIIFVETGLVVMPFLPGDSLLFVVGMFAAQGTLNIWSCLTLLVVAAVLGDACNYYIGKYIGHHILRWRLFGRQLVKPGHLEKAQQFYENHGSRTIIMARFIPLVRTFAPFVAGVGKMKYSVFLTFNFIGGLVWVAGLSLAGYFLGQVDFVYNNFEKVIFLIILISVTPVIFTLLRNKLRSKRMVTSI